MKDIKVKVLKKHIIRGKRREESLCPIALALKEKTHKKVKVTGQYINGVLCPVYISNKMYGGSTKAMAIKIIRFVSKFDNWEYVKPITLSLRRVK
jgi:hypothetical protein